ncbi:substrate-binding periplasmic protein [Undibacterium sp. Ren11W]|uniref:substrate-binding periplasmic protein n=1 Tax=Undibacterium sp. Ren11W TaxID=3413045 RepID=UPI003BF1CB37
MKTLKQCINYLKQTLILYMSAFLFILLLLPDLVYSQTLTIYTEDWPPISYQANSKMEGMGVEIVQALQAKIGTTEVITMVPWARGYKSLLEEANVMLFSVGRSVEREKLMTLLGPIAISSTALYTQRGNAARLLAMGDKIYELPVGAYRGSIFADTAKKKGFTKLDLAAAPKITANMLFAKRFELWVEGSLAVPSIVKETGHAPDEVERVMVLDNLELYLAFSKASSPTIIRAWEEALKAIKKDGSFQKIHQKWLANEPAPMEVLLLNPSSQPTH